MFYAKAWTSDGTYSGEWGPFTSQTAARAKIVDELRSRIQRGVPFADLLTDANNAERKMARLWALLLAFTASEDSRAEGFEAAAQVRAHGRVMIDGLAYGVYGTSRVTEDELKELDAVTLRLIISGKKGNDLDPEAKQKAQEELDRRVERWTEDVATPTPEEAAAMEDALVERIGAEVAQRLEMGDWTDAKLEEVAFGGAAFSEAVKEAAHAEIASRKIRYPTAEERQLSRDRRVRARANRVLADAPDLDAAFGREDEDSSL